MFLRCFDPGDGSSWQHFLSPDGEAWQKVNAHLLDKDPAEPAIFADAHDMMLIHGMNGSVTDKALCSGLGPAGNLQLWLYGFEVGN